MAWKLPVFTFRAKVAFLLSGIILLLGVIAVGHARSDMRRILGAELETRGRAIAEDIAANSVDHLLTGDLFGLYELVNRTKLHNPDVRYILIIGPAGKVQVNTFGKGIPEGLLEANVLAPGNDSEMRRIQTEEALIRDIAVPILGGRAGTVRVGMSDQGVEAAARHNTTELNALVGLAVALSLASAYGLAYYLTRPLSQLLGAVQSVTRGNLSQRVPYPGGDEVGQLGRAFNVMTEALEEKEAARRALLGKVISSQEEERKRVSRELHDELAQRLTSVLLSLEAAESGPQGTDQSTQAIQRARQMVEGSLAETRKLIADLRPSVLDDLGLVPALRSYAQTHLHPVQCEVAMSTSGIPDSLPSTLETAVFRIVQEAINNIAKHAQATSTRVVLRLRDGVLQGEVSDNGRGFRLTARGKDSGAEASGLGLQGMQERAALLGGKLSIWSDEGKGTWVSFSIPLYLER